MPLYGPNFWRIFREKNKFSVQTSLKFGIKALEILEKIHAKKIIHQDLKPENFVLNLHDLTKIHLIDFGLSKTLKNESKIPNKEEGYCGNTIYMSVNAYMEMETCQRDDLESLGYILVEFMKGSLPWRNGK